MGAQDRISLIVCAYNAGRDDIERLLDGVLALDARPEIVLIDDGSDVPLSEVLQGSAVPDHARVHRLGTNGGLFAARAAGVALATRDYVQFADADDVVEGGFYAALDAAPLETDIVGFRALTVHADGTVVPRGEPHPPHRLDGAPAILGAFLDFRYLFSVWNKLYRRDLLERQRAAIGSYPRLNHYEDLALNALAFGMADSFEHREIAGYRYVQHPDQMTAITGASALREMAGDLQTAYDLIERVFHDSLPEEERAAALRNLAAREVQSVMRLFTEIAGADTPDAILALPDDLPPRLATRRGFGAALLGERQAMNTLRDRLSDHRDRIDRLNAVMAHLRNHPAGDTASRPQSAEG